MKNLRELEKEISDVINVKYSEAQSIMPSENAGYKSYGKNWASVVSVDIVGFKNMVIKESNEKIVKLIQVFTDILAEKAKEYSNLRDIYFAGDEVIAVFDGSKKGLITNAIDYCIYANSLVNHVISSVFKSKYDISVTAGIGMWTSQDNSLVMIGNKGSKDTTTTLVGNAINRASFLAKKANRKFGHKKYPPILMNYLSYNNAIGSTEESLSKWGEKQGTEFDKSIYGCSIVKSKYKK